MIQPVVICGLTGSGKSTIARGVSLATDWPLISSGDIARDMAHEDPLTSAQLAGGAWAPEIALRAKVMERIERAIMTNESFVLEGFPRRLEQLILLEQTPNLQPLYVHLVCPDIVCIRRLIKRARPGDHPDALVARWQSYRDHTLPMLEAIGPDLHTIDSQRDPTETVAYILDYLGHHEVFR